MSIPGRGDDRAGGGHGGRSRAGGLDRPGRSRGRARPCVRGRTRRAAGRHRRVWGRGSPRSGSPSRPTTPDAPSSPGRRSCRPTPATWSERGRDAAGIRRAVRPGRRARTAVAERRAQAAATGSRRRRTRGVDRVSLRRRGHAPQRFWSSPRCRSGASRRYLRGGRDRSGARRRRVVVFRRPARHLARWTHVHRVDLDHRQRVGRALHQGRQAEQAADLQRAWDGTITTTRRSSSGATGTSWCSSRRTPATTCLPRGFRA